jgi:predicted DNA-binding protein
MQRTTKTTQLNVRFPQELRERLEALAAAEARTLSDYVRVQLERIARRKPRRRAA